MDFSKNSNVLKKKVSPIISPTTYFLALAQGWLGDFLSIWFVQFSSTRIPFVLVLLRARSVQFCIVVAPNADRSDLDMKP